MQPQPTDAEEFSHKDLPGNPFIMSSFHDWASEQQRQRAIMKKEHPDLHPECHRCGDCCTYTYYKLQISSQMVKELRSKERDPHGWWIMGDRVLNFYQPFWPAGASDNQVTSIRFTGPIGDDYYEFHKKTGRRHGYWTLNADGWICCYSPNYCIHLGYDKEGKATCAAYATRPNICRGYYCGRFFKDEKLNQEVK